MVTKLVSTEDKKRILRKITTEARKRARAACPSKTLRRAMQVRVDSQTEARVHIPHYWAVFYHDGRGPIVAKGKKLIFFANPKNDPRLVGGFPIKRSDIKHLSEDEYLDGLEKNKALRGTGQVYMHVLESVGPSPAHPFFDQGMVGFIRVVNEIVQEEIGRTVQTFLDATNEKKTIVIQL